MLYRLTPCHVVTLAGPRLGSTSNRLVLGPALEKDILDCRRRMLEAFDAGDPGWYETADAGRFFVRDGPALRLKDEYFFIASFDCLEGDLRLRCTRRSDRKYMEIPLAREFFPAIRAVLPKLAAGAWNRKGGSAETPALTALLDVLIERDVMVAVDRAPQVRVRDDYRVTFIGHACLLLETPSTRILIDPLFNYAPCPSMNVVALLQEKIDAVVISHPHWDHFHHDSLLLIDPATPIYVPKPVAPASLVNIDTVAMARDFGFTEVRTLSRWEGVTIGDIELLPLPFHGERCGPEAPNDAIAYALRLGGKTLAGFVDTCADEFGDMDDIARELRARWGEIDFLFAPCTEFRWPLYMYTRRPLFLSHRTEQFTGSPRDCLRWASLLHARRLIPYAAFMLDEGDCEERSPMQAGSIDELLALAAATGRAVAPLQVRTALRWKEGGQESVAPWQAPDEDAQEESKPGALCA